MKLLDFLRAEYGNTNEDYRSISLSKWYQKSDLSGLLSIYKECIQSGVSLSISLDVECGSSCETFLDNFRLSQSGIDCLLNCAPEEERDDLRYELSVAKSVEDEPESLVQELDRVFSRSSFYKIKSKIYVSKPEICRQFYRNHKGEFHNYLMWLSFERFCSFVNSDPKTFLQQVWEREYPVVVIPDLERTISCKFCLMTPEPSFVKTANREAYRLFRGLALEMLKSEYAIRFLLSLTLSPSDPESEKFLKNKINVGRFSTEKVDVPFPESQYYDFKEKPTNTAKSVAAFANACGGVVVYGVDNGGRLVGCDRRTDPDQVSNALNEIEPTVRYEQIGADIDGRYVFAMIVWSGGEKDVYTLRTGERPFRYHSTTRYFRSDDEVLKERKKLCES